MLALASTCTCRLVNKWATCPLIAVFMGTMICCMLLLRSHLFVQSYPLRSYTSIVSLVTDICLCISFAACTFTGQHL